MKTSILFLAMASAHLMSAVEDEAGSASGAGEAATRSTATIRPDLTGYQTVKSASGSGTKICGDAVSLALAGATLDEAYEFVSGVVGTKETELRAKYSERNPGQQRMFLGNLIRGALVGKNKERAAEVQTQFDSAVAGLRKGVDARLAAAAEEKAKAKAATDQKKADEKAAKAAKAPAKPDAAPAKPAKADKPAKA